ncbi:MAG: glycosyltransferase family 2 protein [Armatimonadota bacterium]
MNLDRKPLVSIVVPCYNHGKLIQDTIKSITRQTFTDWECIVVNDGSIDNSEEVIQSLAAKDARVVYVSQPE